MHNNQLVTAWIALFPPPHFHLNYQERLPIYTTNRDALIATLPALMPHIDQDIRCISATLQSPPDEILHSLSKENLWAKPGFADFLCVNANISMDVESLQKANDRILEPWTITAFATIIMSDAIEQLSVLSELSYPGCIDVLGGRVIAEGAVPAPIESKRSYTDIRFPLGDNRLTWPPLMDLDIMDVVIWAKKTNYFSGRMTSTRVERTLAAYTYVIGLASESDRDGEILFRAMQGLEAFYCDGIGDLRRQLKEKSSIWLGSWEDKKNIVGSLYDLRSKFVHGSLNFTYRGIDSIAWHENRNAMETLIDGAELAVRMLIASLQKCCREGTIDVRWSYAIETSS